MAPKLTLHIGQFKTGTTTIQQVLADRADSLRAQGVLYPKFGRSTDHWLAVGGLFLLSSETLDSTFDYKRRQVLANAPRFQSSWLELRKELESWPGEVVLSCESLVMAKTSLVDYLVSEFPHSQIKVILGARNPSKLISSWYQETAKRTRVVSFDEFVLNLLNGLLEQKPGPYDWMSTERVRRVWERDGIEFLQFGDGHTGIAAVIQQTLSTVGVDLEETPPATNPAMTRSAVVAWQEYLDWRRPPSMRLANTVRRRAFAAASAANDPQVGGTFALSSELAALVDEAFSPIHGESREALTALGDYLGSETHPLTLGAIGSEAPLVRELSERLVRWDKVLSPSLGFAMHAKARLSGRQWQTPDWSTINHGYV